MTANVERKGLPRVLRDYWMAMLALTLVAFAICYARGTRILMPPAHHFNDLMCYKERFLRYGTEAFYGNIPGKAQWTYPAAMAVLYRVFYLFAHPLMLFFVAFAAVCGWGAIWFAREIRQRGASYGTAIGFVATALATSYPLWFLVESANLELFVVLFVGLGVVAYLRGRLWWAAGLFGIATALKLFPVVYLALFFSRRESKKMVFGAGVAAVAILLSHWMVGPTLGTALRGTRSAMEIYSLAFVLASRPYELGFDHSLFTLVKHVYLGWQTTVGRPGISLAQVERYYMVGVVLGAAVLWIARIGKLPPLNRVLAVTVLTLLLPPVSWDYRLVHLYIPWAFVVLVILEQRGEAHRSFPWILLAFAIVFTPQSYLYYWIGKYGVSFAVGYGAQVKVAALLGIFVFAIRYPLPEAAEPKGAAA